MNGINAIQTKLEAAVGTGGHSVAYLVVIVVLECHGGAGYGQPGIGGSQTTYYGRIGCMVRYGDQRVETRLRKAEVADGEGHNIRGVFATDVYAVCPKARVLGYSESARGAAVLIGDSLGCG